MTLDDAQSFAADWIAVWNAHDLGAILDHYAQDVTFYSPVIARVTGEPTSYVSGKGDLERYWARALKLAPDLHFELQDLYVGADSLVVHYTNQLGRHCAETFVFAASGKIIFSVATVRPEQSAQTQGVTS